MLLPCDVAALPNCNWLAGRKTPSVMQVMGAFGFPFVEDE